MSIGGSLFIRNAIQHDYCVEESILSLMPLCDDIVVLDCRSNDGTTERLEKMANRYSKMRLFKNITWECATDYSRLRILANMAISFLKTDWHFMIQADEVLHESSIPVIKEITERFKHDSLTFLMRRPHIFGNMDHQISYAIPNERKPASDSVFRLGRLHHLAVGDAESLFATRYSTEYLEQMTLFHYGYARKNVCNLTKPIEMQAWFHGPGHSPDQRLLDMKANDGVFRPEAFFRWDELSRLKMSHPAVAQKWVDDRRAEHPFQPPETT